jgi:S-formylglutathione hydrolase FrmB
MTSPPSFRTIELSDPAYESDGLRHVTVKSNALRRRADVTLWVPESCAEAPMPVIILMHGVYGSHWAWALKGGAHHTANQLIADGKLPPVVLAMPSDGLWGDGSCYLPHADADYESWIVDEVPTIAARVVPSVTDKSPLFIAGLSMGGYGAMRLGASYPHRFNGISAHSSACTFAQMDQFTEESGHDYQLLDKTPRNVIDAILGNRDRLPPLRFDCGLDDFLIEQNRELHQQLLAANVDHVYEEFPGEHNWDYWTTHIVDTFRFFAAIL